MLKTAAAAACLLLVATGAAAQTPAPATTPVSDPTAAQIASWIAGRHGEVDGVDAEPLQGAAPPRDGRIHGEVGASIGSGGYRGGYGVATMPIGTRGDVTVGVSDEHLGDGNRSYGGYGYGGDRRSLAIGINLSGAAQPDDACDVRETRWGPPLPGEPARCRRGDRPGDASVR